MGFLRASLEVSPGVEFERVETEEGLPEIFLATDINPTFLHVGLRRRPTDRLVVRTNLWAGDGGG